jgi:3-oxoacyl-(acyl-carrier-protein) synthase III
MRTTIAGMGIYLPQDVYTSEEIEERAGYKHLGVRTGLCRMLTGCVSRHYAATNELSSDLAALAGREALANAAIRPEDVDALIFCSVTHDFAEPATANVVADKLDIRNAYAFDIKNACNAFLSGMDVADSLIRTGKAQTVLVVSGEALSKWSKFNYDNKEELLERAPVALSVGDGGGAFVMRPCESPNRGIVKTRFVTIPELWNNNVIWGGGVAFPGDPEKMYIPGTTKKLMEMHGSVVTHFIPQFLASVGWEVGDIDAIIPSQVAKWINRNIEKTLGVKDDAIVQIVEDTGNVGACNIPLATYRGWKAGKIETGSKVIMLGGAVGANIGAICLVM